MDITWSFQGGRLSSHLGLKTTLIGARMSVLLVEPVIPGNAGLYTCTARNRAGISNASATLEVFGRLNDEKCKTKLRGTGSCAAAVFINVLGYDKL